MHILLSMNSATTTETMQTVRIIKGKTVRVYTVIKGQPVASRWTLDAGSENVVVAEAMTEIRECLMSGWKMIAA